jgi:hypothetical protein
MRILGAARFVLVIGAVAILVGCNQTDFPKYNALGDLRILTVIADTPEANPGDTVTFTPVVSDLGGNGRELGYAVQACIDPGVGIGAVPACVNPDPTSLQTGTISISAGVSRTYTGPVASFSLTMPDAETLFANRSDADQYNGVAYLVFYSISVPDGPSVNSFLRVFITPGSKTPKNQNPVIASVDLNDVPVSGVIPVPTSSVNFRVTSPASSAETYQVMNTDGSFTTRTEELVTTWFVSDGLFDFIRTIGDSENSWAPPESRPANRGIVILVVTRDGRGGAAFQKLELN